VDFGKIEEEFRKSGIDLRKAVAEESYRRKKLFLSLVISREA